MNDNTFEIAPELSDLERFFLSGNGREPPTLIPEPRPIEGAALKHEIESYLQGRSEKSQLRVPRKDLGNIVENFKRFMSTAEDTCGRSALVEAYCGNSKSDSKSIYSHRLNREKSLDRRSMNERFKLVEAACKAMNKRGQTIEAAAACVSLFEGTEVRAIIEYDFDKDALGDAGQQLADAWGLISRALDQECDLVGWFKNISQKKNLSSTLIAKLLECEVALDLTAVFNLDTLRTYLKIANADINTPKGDMMWCSEKASFDSLNLPIHVHDLSVAPAVTLFRQRFAGRKGYLRNLRTDKRGEGRVGIVFWQEVMLALLPDYEGFIAPFLINRQRASLHDGHDGGKERPLAYPFVRIFGAEDEGYVPVTLPGNRDPHLFEPMEPWTNQVFWHDASFNTQYARVWGARRDITPLFLRGRENSHRLVDKTIKDCAMKSPLAEEDTFFPRDSVGAWVERATIVPDRAGGIGELLRRDFYRKMRILDGNVHRLPLPHAFDRVWGGIGS